MSDQPINRKLAAILAADVAGYSKLMHQDEEATLRRLNEYRGVTDSIIASRGGRIANTAGDSILAEFASPVEAVRAALEIQEALNTRNASLPAEQRMELRIGVNLGDVMVKDGDLWGDGVNVAARLQTIAPPGGVCVSSSIHDQIEGKLTLQFRDMGQQSLKNIARPVRAFSVAAGSSVRRAHGGTRSRTPLLIAAAVVLIAAGAAGAWFGGVFRDTSPSRYDGVWQGTYSCPTAGQSAEFTRPATVVVRGGNLPYYAGIPGQTGFFSIAGTVRADDTIELSGPGINVNAANYQYVMTGKFVGDQLSVVAAPPVRPCVLKLVRQRNADVAAVQRNIDADIAKRNAEADQLRLNAEADRKKADADAAKAAADAAKARADADAARAKADADAAKAKADADAAAAKAKAEADKRAANPPSVATAPKATPGARINRFDGVWRGELACAAGGPDNRQATNVARIVRIKDGEMTFESGGTLGQPRTYRAVGTVLDDDTIDLRGPGTSQRGTPFQFHLAGKFNGNSFSGDTVLAGRPCKVTLTRER
jgi:class 3 adenylate cyclase